MARIGTAPEETRAAGERAALLDGMSMILASERSSVALYRRYASDTEDPALRDHWQRFGDRAQTHAQLAESAVTALRGDAQYRSAAALEIERCTQTMMTVAAPEGVDDLLRLGHLISVESLSRLYWRSVGRALPRIKEPATVKVLRDAAAVIERDKNQHIAWNASTLENRMGKVLAGG